MDYTRSEALMRVAPRSVPRVSALDYAHRGPVLVVSTGATFVHLDLEELTPDEAQATVTRLRSALEVFREQLADWHERAASDRTGPYPIPPLVYGTPDDDAGTDTDSDAGPGGDVG